MSVPVPAEPAAPAGGSALEARDALSKMIRARIKARNHTVGSADIYAILAAADIYAARAAGAARTEANREAAEIPSLIVKIDGELSPADIEQLKRDFLAAQGKPPAVLLDAAQAEKMLAGQQARIARLEDRIRHLTQDDDDDHAEDLGRAEAHAERAETEARAGAALKGEQ
jgi:hypothetical protein